MLIFDYFEQNTRVRAPPIFTYFGTLKFRLYLLFSATKMHLIYAQASQKVLRIMAIFGPFWTLLPGFSKENRGKLDPLCAKLLHRLAHE